MFSKRVKCIRELNREVEVLDRKIIREISKLNQNINLEVRKRFHRILPGLQIKLAKVYLDDFVKNEKQGTPLLVRIISVNNKFVHENGEWVEPVGRSKYYELSDNRITVETLRETCLDLSETLGINFQIDVVSGPCE